ncbi:MAG TPA: hypothetical protein VKI44_06310 [Acetobacteraceae bacterium]|nr:hypothetical protein [Acetobacteraceae bacterium]
MAHAQAGHGKPVAAVVPYADAAAREAIEDAANADVAALAEWEAAGPSARCNP